jgi:hypothetical protein
MGCEGDEDAKRGAKKEVALGGWAEAARWTPATTPRFSHFREGLI